MSRLTKALLLILSLTFFYTTPVYKICLAYASENIGVKSALQVFYVAKANEEWNALCDWGLHMRAVSKGWG